MHLLLAEKGSLAQTAEAVDLGQSPGEIVFLSAADTELAALSSAARRLHLAPGRLRLASLMRLTHPMSVDTYVERTLSHARLVVVRLLGGIGYWPYGVDALRAAAQRNGFALAFLPGDDRPDPALDAAGTLAPSVCERLAAYLREGGPDNAMHFVEACSAVIDDEEWPPDARPLLRAGLMERVSRAAPDAPVASVVFYRALMQSGQTEAIEALCEGLERRGLRALPVFVSSLKDAVTQETVRHLFTASPPDVVLNCTGFAVSPAGQAHSPTVLDEQGAPVIQCVLAGTSEETWAGSDRGLGARDLAMNIALPEVDGRVLAGAVAFKSAATWDPTCEVDVVTHRPLDANIDFACTLAAQWSSLRRKPASGRRIALLLANYPNRDGRIANGVGLDTPAGAMTALTAMRQAGYRVDDLPGDGNGLVEHLLAGPTNAGIAGRAIRETLALEDYRAFFDTLPQALRQAVTERWGRPEDDPFHIVGTGFALPFALFGNIAVGVQPARGYNIDPKESYHAPDLPPPHNYVAAYAWLRTVFSADAVIHMGKHGNLEWLPGKALALSQACAPRAILGPLPHLYPFIVNDPGEGTQAKRRNAAVIVDHLTPPLARAESYGMLRDLEALVDEYYEAEQGDRRRADALRPKILQLAADSGLAEDAGIAGEAAPDAALVKLDAYLCDLKEMQIRDGLHVFGRSPEGGLRDELVVAMLRLPRGTGPQDASLIRALARDLELGDFDPLSCELSAPWTGNRPQILNRISTNPWRSCGDTVERLELLSSRLVAGTPDVDIPMPATAPVLQYMRDTLAPAVDGCGQAELAGLLTGLAGRFLAPGPSGAPTRGRPDVLPTGRNFYSVDTRAVPTETAFALGRKSAEALVTRHLQDHGEWLRAIGLTVWGTANMRTGGDDIAQALALIGARPVWDGGSRRVTGFEIVPLAALGRPRVDVTLRISGFFRDAFPDQIALFDAAVRAIGALDEPDTENPLAARMRVDAAALVDGGSTPEEARRRAGFRVFGSRPGAYGAGLQALIDEGGWADKRDFAEAFLVWGGYAYGADGEGEADRQALETRLSQVDAVVQNQDNREHDLLDSDDYYQFEGGMSAAVETLTGRRPHAYHNDHSRPEHPVIRTLDEEIGRVLRARVVNPKWISGVMRHGYKGAFEIAATVDYLFAFAATTGAVRDHHFDLVHAAFVADETVSAFMRANNPTAYREMVDRLAEAVERGLWRPRSNAARFELDRRGTPQ